MNPQPSDWKTVAVMVRRTLMLKPKSNLGWVFRNVIEWCGGTKNGDVETVGLPPWDAVTVGTKNVE